MKRPWFDDQSGVVLFDEYVGQMDSFRKIMEDNRITEEEVSGQAQRVIELLKKLDQTLDADAKSLVTDVFCEIAVLHALHMKQREGMHLPALPYRDKQP